MNAVTTLRETLVLWWHEVRGHRVRRQRLEGDQYIPCLQCACGVNIRP